MSLEEVRQRYNRGVRVNPEDIARLLPARVAVRVARGCPVQSLETWSEVPERLRIGDCKFASQYGRDLGGDYQAALGTVAGADGVIVTKASLLSARRKRAVIAREKGTKKALRFAVDRLKAVRCCRRGRQEDRRFEVLRPPIRKSHSQRWVARAPVVVVRRSRYSSNGLAAELRAFRRCG